MKTQIISIIQAFCDLYYTAGLIQVGSHEKDGKLIVTADGNPQIICVPLADKVAVYELFNEKPGAVRFVSIPELQKLVINEINILQKK